MYQRTHTFLPNTISFLGNILFPPEANFTFIGETSICTEPVEAQRFILETNPEANINVWDLWIKTGLVASLLIKVVLANFGLALYWLADPLSRCGGSFEYPPMTPLSESDKRALRCNTHSGLKAISIKWALVWFILVAACLANLWGAADWESLQWGDSSDPVIKLTYTILAAGGVCCLVSIAGICYVRKRRASLTVCGVLTGSVRMMAGWMCCSCGDNDGDDHDDYGQNNSIVESTDESSDDENKPSTDAVSSSVTDARVVAIEEEDGNVVVKPTAVMKAEP